MLGRSGISVTTLGFGGGAIGNLSRAISDGEAAATEGAAWDAGIRTFDTRYNYAPAPPAVSERVGRIAAITQAHGVPLAATALAFPLRHPAVSTVIPGLMSAEEVAWAQRHIEEAELAAPEGVERGMTRS
jgi:aryl-alcohol dehydrogenase-like predicted oxidoreductase